jgi:hypothetical protein
MKHIPAILGTATTSLLLACSTTQVAVAPVGPNPTGGLIATKNGQLEVFSAVTGRVEGNNPTWYQHTDYTIYNPKGEVVKYVKNAPGYYATAPRLINLPAGKYVVRAEAKDYPAIRVPVVIEPGRITRVHLDDAWQPAGARETAFVRLPAGNPVGWSAGVR